MIVGIVVCKAHSKRFPNKNRFLLSGEPLFWHSVKPLIESTKIDKVYVATDSEYIRDFSVERGVEVIWRPKNASEDEAPLLSVLRFAYYSLNQQFDMIVTIMANCPGHTAINVDEAVSHMQTGEFREIRSFNKRGEESGLMIFDPIIITQGMEISSHIGCTFSDLKEIHFREDIDE